jgi:hypothetical protein
MAVGKFTINAFEKNYWGSVDTKIACGPLVFNSIADYPKVMMDICNFPDSLLSGQCQPIEVKIKNTGDSPLRGVVLVFHHPEAFVCELPNIVNLEGITLVQHLEPVRPDARTASSADFLTAVSPSAVAGSFDRIRIVRHLVWGGSLLIWSVLLRPSSFVRGHFGGRCVIRGSFLRSRLI